MIKEIIKLTKKDDLVGVLYEPTIEECEFLYSQGIATTSEYYKKNCILDKSCCYVIRKQSFKKECFAN